MKCDRCGVILTISNNGGYAPYGIPLYVCKSCYNKLKEEKAKEKAKEIIKKLIDTLEVIDGEQIRELAVVKEAEQFIKE